MNTGSGSKAEFHLDLSTEENRDLLIQMVKAPLAFKALYEIREHLATVYHKRESADMPTLYGKVLEIMTSNKIDLDSDYEPDTYGTL